MSKPLKPGRKAVALAPSRIRREPARVVTAPPPRSREQDMWTAIVGVVLVAAACSALVVGVSQVTSHGDAAAPEAGDLDRFDYCRGGGGPDCVLDGNTFFMAGERIEIAGIQAPDIHPSRCPEEARRGTRAVQELHRLLNGGPVTVSAATGWGAADNPSLRKVEVNGVDVAQAMVASGAVREYWGGPSAGWC